MEAVQTASAPSFDTVWALVKEVAENQKETDRQMKETDRKLQGHAVVPVTTFR